MVRRCRFNRRAVLLAGAAGLAAPALRATTPLTVFAAASLKGPLDEIAPQARLVYGASGALARQVAQGAPADLVILAATDWMEWLVTQGRVAGPEPVARNRLVLAGPAGAAPLSLEAQAIQDRLGRGRIAMGDPLSVPAGRYAQQAFETMGLWGVVQPNALLAENVRAALAYIARGAVPLGVVYRSDAMFPGVRVLAEFPEKTHSPILYPAALTQQAPPDAARLRQTIAQATEVFQRHGFDPI